MLQMKKIALPLLLLALCSTGYSQPNRQAPWWKANNLRVIQVNLPAYEAATLNADSLVYDLQNFSANTVIINAGGIMAFYPTKLPFHYTNPYMKPEVLADVVRKCHEKSIKVIVRFDFSRVHESIFKAHPDWCYISPKGERIINTDMYVASINGPYVQQHAFKIIEEVLDQFPVDGIFLNMPGYQVRNPYESKYHGIDQNEYDKEAFKKYSDGKQLPIKEDKDDPLFQEYVEFKKHSVEEWSRRLYEMVRARSNQVAICTYSDKYVDIIRHEAQTNSLPYWPYTSSDNVNNAVNSYPEHVISNASIQQISFQSRYNAVEPEETAIRLYENMANGSGLDMSMMGDMRGYEDERNYPVFKKIYGLHKKHEPYFGNYRSTAKVAVIAPGSWPSGEQMQEYRGIQLMLKESHVQFDIIEDAQLAAQKERIESYQLIILPDINYLSKQATDVLKEACNKGANMLATNKSFSNDPETIAEIFGAEIVNGANDGSGNYLRINDKTVFKRLDKQAMIFWKFNLGLYNFENAEKTFLPVLSKGRPGPPEIIGGHEPTGYYAAAINNYGKGKALLLPANIGKLYYLHGYEQHKNIILDLITELQPDLFSDVVTNAHERVEIIVNQFGKNLPGRDRKKMDGTIVHFINITGFSGNTYFRPHIIDDIRFSLKLASRPSKVFTLTDKKPLPFTYKDGTLTTTLKKLDEFESVVIE